jgi:Type VI secretion system (T6SS), amidase effector protein 4
VNLAGFTGVKCWGNHTPKHILRAQELANWIATQTATFGPLIKYTKRMSSADFSGKTGLVFIQDGWGATDHIDIWNGSKLKGGDPSYFARGKQIWFWTL